MHIYNMLPVYTTLSDCCAVRSMINPTSTPDVNNIILEWVVKVSLSIRSVSTSSTVGADAAIEVTCVPALIQSPITTGSIVVVQRENNITPCWSRGRETGKRGRTAYPREDASNRGMPNCIDVHSGLRPGNDPSVSPDEIRCFFAVDCRSCVISLWHDCFQPPAAQIGPDCGIPFHFAPHAKRPVSHMQ